MTTFESYMFSNTSLPVLMSERLRKWGLKRWELNMKLKYLLQCTMILTQYHHKCTNDTKQIKLVKHLSYLIISLFENLGTTHFQIIVMDDPRHVAEPQRRKASLFRRLGPFAPPQYRWSKRLSYTNERKPVMVASDWFSIRFSDDRIRFRLSIW